MTTVLDTLPFEPDLVHLLADLRIDAGSDDAAALRAMVEEARAIARPKVAYRVAGIDRKEDAGVSVDGVAFASRVLRVNLEPTQRVFAFVATCGAELEAWAAPIGGLLEQYWADAIMELALGFALRALDDELASRFGTAGLSMMNPGSLPDWPLSEQRPLFELVGPAVASIGVRLTDSYLMQPAKSVSGVLFAGESGFESCQLCTLEHCPHRRASYDPALYADKYAARD